MSTEAVDERLMTGRPWIAMGVLATAVAMSATTAPALAADDDETPTSAAPQFPGEIAGTVLWAGRPRSWLHNDDCEVHVFDMEGHPGVRTGLGNVVVVAQPLGRQNQRWFRELPLEPQDELELEWDDEIFQPVMAIPLGQSLHIRNNLAVDRQLRVYRGRALVQTIELAAKGEQQVTLAEGIFRFADSTSGATAWAYVTPYPAEVSGGNCRFVFSNLPTGLYRLTGWHPRAGTRSRQFPVGKGKTNYLTPLLFGATAHQACVSEGFKCYGPNSSR